LFVDNKLLIDEGLNLIIMLRLSLFEISSIKFEGLSFFWTANILLWKNKISVHDEQIPVKEEFETKARFISGTPMEISKQTPPNRGSF
jgi:hypothetical protein